MTTRPSRWPHPALVFVVLAWGLNFSIIKIAYLEVSPPALALVRFGAMAVLLVAWCLAGRQSLSYPKGSVGKLLLAGFVGSGVYMVFFLEGMRTAPAALGAIALATSPLFATGLSVALRQDAFTWRLVAGSLVAFGGVAVGILGGTADSDGSAMGALLVLVAAILWAVSVVIYRGLLKEMTPVRALTLSLPGALPVLAVYGTTAVVTTDWPSVTMHGWGALAYLVFVAGVGAFAAYYRGLADVGPARSSMTQYFVTPVAAIFASFVIPEPPRAAELVSLVIVICGVLLAAWKPPTVIDERTDTAPPTQETQQNSSA